MSDKQSLRRLPFFADIADAELERFDRRCAWKRFEEGETVVDFEDASTDVYFIASGQVRALIRTAAGKEIILAEMRAGQFFGELAAIDGAMRSANVTALVRSELCIMPAKAFADLCHSSSAFCDKILKLLTTRIRELNARLTEQTIFDLKHRLYSELLRMSHQRASGGGQRVISPPPFHHILAARIGCRREQVTREFSVLHAEGLIEKQRGALILLKPETLAKRIDDAMHSEGRH